jgi:hypothetical protein
MSLFRDPRSLLAQAYLALAIVIVSGVPFAARADDPCEDANREAQVMEQSLRNALAKTPAGGAFAVDGLEAGEPAQRLAIRYVADGRTVFRHELRAPDSGAWVKAAVSAGGRVLTWGHHSGGKHCCYCEHSLRIEADRLVLTDTVAKRTRSSHRIKAAAPAPVDTTPAASSARASTDNVVTQSPRDPRTEASPPPNSTDGSNLANKLAAHFLGKRVAYRFKGSSDEPPMDVTVSVCRDGSFVFRDHLVERPGNLGGGPAVRQGRWRVRNMSGHGVVELAFADGDVAQYAAMVRGGQTYVNGERVRLTDDDSDCGDAAPSAVATVATTAASSPAAGDWDGFFTAFRGAVQRRDRAALQGMMSSQFEYANALAVPPKEVFSQLDFDGGTNWTILEKTLAQPVKPFKLAEATRPLRSATHPAPCGEGCRYQSEVVFEQEPSGQWRWKAMFFPGD